MPVPAHRRRDAIERCKDVEAVSVDCEAQILPCRKTRHRFVDALMSQVITCYWNLAQSVSARINVRFRNEMRTACYYYRA
jgi:hypothetical protein